VIILATIAIVVAVVLMLWPNSRRDLDGKHTMAPPPAPERMQTEPEIKPPQVPAPQVPPPAPQTGATRDPWNDQLAPVPPDPAGPTDTDPDDDDLALKNPFTSPQAPGQPPGTGHLQLNGRGAMIFAVTKHVCRKMQQCGADDPMITNTCDAIVHSAAPTPDDCPAYDRCLRHIDAMSCANQGDLLKQLNLLFAQFRDCAEATRCR
jgi:hypothetical protein